MKDKTTAGILGILLGGFGVHRFYLGQTLLGVVYLLFFWAIIPWIVGLIDGILILTKPQEDFDQKYNNGKASGNPWVSPVFTRNTADEIAKLHKLKMDGALTEEEFQKRKEQLL